jgi:hypothetical protein
MPLPKQLAISIILRMIEKEALFEVDMKKLVFLFILLLIAGGCVFFFGWIQILIPAETYAVVFTKTGGFDSRVVEPGKFVWRWERLIPTNMTLYKFELAPYATRASFRSGLPSAELYSSVLPERPGFNFEADIELEIRVRPESLPVLVSEAELRPEGLAQYYEGIAADYAQAVAESAYRDATLSVFELQKSIAADFASRYPDLEVISVRLRRLERPDTKLYALAQSTYQELVETQQEARKSAAGQLALEQARASAGIEKERASLELLSEYGELLTKYPVLLQAIYVQNVSGIKDLKIPELQLPEVIQGNPESGD